MQPIGSASGYRLSLIKQTHRTVVAAMSLRESEPLRFGTLFSLHPNENLGRLMSLQLMQRLPIE
jgi:hypothetical protein